MNLPVGVNIQSLIKDAFVVVVFVVGFSLGGLWQYAARLSDQNDQLNDVVASTKEAEKVSASVSGAVQTYTEAAVDNGNSYIQAISECPTVSVSEYDALGVLIASSNSAIRDAGKVPRDTEAKRSKR